MLHLAIYHGNCTDGFAAFSIYHKWAMTKGWTVVGYPVAPQDARTWPAIPSTEFTVAFLDVVPDGTALLLWEKAASHTTIIDHHASSSEAFLSDPVVGNFPQKKGQVIHFSIESCAAILAHTKYYPLEPVPDWLRHVDRVDRWTDVTPHDLALRESLHAIAKIPVSHPGPEGTARALALLDTFIRLYSASGPDALDLIAESERLLAAKKTKLDALLSNPRRTSRIKVDPDYCEETWCPPSWCGQVIFSIDTTGVYGFDSTLASHLVFTKCPEVTVFINYNQFADRNYKYCVRSRDFDVTQGDLFRGHPCAAGGVLKGPSSPFLV